MIIRAEQMSVFQTAAEENFERRLAAHLLEDYSSSVVRLPDSESAVKELSEEKLMWLVKFCIERARNYGMTYESTISAYTAIMFDAAPNFDKHNLTSLCLKDETVEPNERINEILKLLNDEHWERIRNDYDPNAWLPAEEQTESAETSEKSGNAENPDLSKTVMNTEEEKPQTPPSAKKPDFEQTAINTETAEKSKNPKEVKDFGLDETMMNYEAAPKSAQPKKDDDFDFLNTVVNIDLDKE